MKFRLPNVVSSRAARSMLVTQKHSPQILFFGGLALMGATVVSAARGTLKLNDTLEQIRFEREMISDKVAENPEAFTERDIAKLNAYVTSRGIVKIARLYLPALSLGVASVACLTSSHNQLNRRNAGLSAALAATERAMDSYRGRVREAFGEDRELEIWRGQKTEMVPVLDDEGRETKSKKKVKTGGGHSQYARLWGPETTGEWDPQPEYNLPKLRSIQEWGTMRLNHKGHLFLNEIYDELGLSRTPAGQVVGWLSQKNGGTDGYVDFGVLKQGDDVVEFLDFIQGREDHIWLDFNVDGEVFRSIG